MNTQILTSRDHNPEGLPQLHFDFNHNNKLDARAFTTIRKPDNRWKSGTELAVYESGDWYRGAVKVWSIKATTINQLTNEECLLDTGHLKPRTIEILKKCYGDYLEGPEGYNMPLVIVTLVKMDEYFMQRELPILEPGPMRDYLDFRQHRPGKVVPAGKKEAPVIEFNLFTHSR